MNRDDYRSTTFIQQYTSQASTLLRGPTWLEQPFICDGIRHAQVHQQAAQLYWHYMDTGHSSPICLASEDKTVCAAALLAALAGGPPLLLPYALSPRALTALQTATAYTHALASPELELPAGIERLPLPTELSGQESRPLPHKPVQGAMLYLFTGGSTGAPQLWSKTAANLFGEALFIAAHHGIGTQDRIAATIAPYHIYGLLYSVLLPLVSGAAVLAETPSFPEEISEAVRANRISIFISVPAHYRALQGKSCVSPDLRLAFSSADMLDATSNQAFCQANQVGIAEIYGSTETGGIACRNRFLGEEHFTVLPLVDWQPSHEKRLMVRSPFLSPELPLDAAGYFHTADRVAAQDDARFFLLGRADLVVKVAGKRVDMEAIRLLIQEQPGVREALVLALPATGSRENHIAAVVAESKPGIVEAEALRRVLGQQLEPYALPRVIKIVAQIPVKANGKYDREAILALVAA